MQYKEGDLFPLFFFDDTDYFVKEANHADPLY